MDIPWMHAAKLCRHHHLFQIEGVTKKKTLIVDYGKKKIRTSILIKKKQK